MRLILHGNMHTLPTNCITVRTRFPLASFPIRRQRHREIRGQPRVGLSKGLAEVKAGFKIEQNIDRMGSEAGFL